MFLKFQTFFLIFVNSPLYLNALTHYRGSTKTKVKVPMLAKVICFLIKLNFCVFLHIFGVQKEFCFQTNFGGKILGQKIKSV